MEELIARYAKLPQRQRYLGFAAVVLLLGAVYWYFSYSGQSRKLETLQKSYEALQSEQQQKQTYLEKLSKNEAQLDALKRKLDGVRAQLPDDPDVPQLLAQLGAKARQAGLEIDRFEPKQQKAQDFYAEIAFDVKLRGSYHEIGVFLDSLSQLDRILNVTNIIMTNPKSVSEKIVVDAGFTLKTYRFLEESLAAAASQKGKDKKGKDKGK